MRFVLNAMISFEALPYVSFLALVKLDAFSNKSSHYRHATSAVAVHFVSLAPRVELLIDNVCAMADIRPTCARPN